LILVVAQGLTARQAGKVVDEALLRIQARLQTSSAQKGGDTAEAR
jgi:hypothetical protein